MTDRQRYLETILFGKPDRVPFSPGGPGVWIKHTMIPQFEEKVIEEREESLVVQDWKGNVCEISKRFDVTYLRTARDFVTRKWIKCPVVWQADGILRRRRQTRDG